MRGRCGRIWQESAQKNYLGVSMSMYSHIPVRRQIWRYSLQCLKPGDTIMGMNLDHGGHLTHGSPVNFSGSYFHVVPYGVNDEGFIDYDKVRRTCNGM